MIWVGLDLHKKYITACAMDEAGVVVAEHRRLPADAEALVLWLTGLGGPVTVAMEATLYWAWLHDQLSAAGLAAVAAHPSQVKLIWQARAKTDPIDARKLADLLRTNLLLAELGDIRRFRTSHELAAYAGLTPSTQSSGGKTTHGGVGRSGSPWLKWILIEIVQHLKLAPGPVGEPYQRLLRSKGKAKATVAAARKLSCYLYWCLQEGWSYEQWLRQHDKLEVRPVHALGSAA